MANSPKPRAEDLVVEVDGERTAASLVGSKLRTVYVRHEKGLVESPLMGDDSAPDLSRDEFEEIAWAIAQSKARKLGWID